MNDFKERIMYKGYNEAGKPLGYVEQKNESKLKESVFLQGVTCFVIDKKTGQVMLERRQNKGLTPGKIDLVSGHVDNNEVPIQSMIRELQEEVGIPENEAINAKWIGKLPLAFESKGKIKKFFIEFFCLIRQSEELHLQESEVAEIFFVPLEEAFEMIRTGQTKFPKEQDGNYEPIFQKVQELYKGKNLSQENNCKE